MAIAHVAIVIDDVQAQGCLVEVDDAVERAFTQTILLMPQGPKKYYAHSDIFQFTPREFGNQICPAEFV